MRILAVDLGMARTGLAVSDIGEQLASPVCTITQYYLPDRMVAQVAQEAKNKDVGLIVVGHPRNMDGSRGESAKRAEEFASLLQKQTGLPVELWDERMTTVTAIGYLNEADVRGKKRKAVVDTVAATIILQDFLEHRRLMREKADT